ncbi:MAG: hypothetical protein V6Z81_04425 [Parvularculales bacterium]
MSNLEKEYEAYKKLLPALLGSDGSGEGKYALIIGDQHIGTYVAYEDALQEGYEKAKLGPFMVKKISGNDNISYFSRDIDGSCHTSPSK